MCLDDLRQLTVASGGREFSSGDAVTGKSPVLPACSYPRHERRRGHSWEKDELESEGEK